MTLTKSFGYALRGILYVALSGADKRRIQLDEISKTLRLPRYFLGKVMLRLAKEGILDSGKGYNGGFCVNESTLDTTLYQLLELTGNPHEAGTCALSLKKCNPQNPCPIHQEATVINDQWNRLFAKKTIRDLLARSESNLLESLTID